MVDETPIRHACDRCHSQKLRCLRSDYGDNCARCVKAGATCVFSPSQRGRRPVLTGNVSQKRSRSIAIGPDATDIVDKSPIDLHKSRTRNTTFSASTSSISPSTPADEMSSSHMRCDLLSSQAWRYILCFSHRMHSC